ncbi:UNVERIFIED_CONTAM: ABC transporter G family member 23 [Sesamum calycinum]|uniref:ABC transporter G family member 23 n=1 Tax=Sesamum calycinum TaxID=2727403 RepID=A0AAW2NTZ6_9LAMI
MQALVGGFGLGSVYVKVRKDEGGVAERLGLFAFSLSFLLSSTVEALPIYLQERQVLMKEASRGAYRVSSYLIANTIIFFPFLFIVAILFSVPLYWIVGLNPSASAFGFFTFVVWLIVLMASSLVLFLSVISPDFISGNSLICTVLGAFFLFSGYFIPREFIPKYWLFMYYVSLYRYPLDCLVINEYWSERNECFSRRVGNDLSDCLLTGGDVLKRRGLDKDTRRMNVSAVTSSGCTTADILTTMVN